MQFKSAEIIWLISILALAVAIEHVAGRSTAAHPAILRHAFHQVYGVRDRGRNGRNERVVGRHRLLGQQVDAALVCHVVALLQLRLQIRVGLPASQERHGGERALEQADAAPGVGEHAAADEQLRIGVNVAAAGTDLVTAREIDVGLARGELNGTLHGAVVGKEVLQHVAGRFGILNAALP